MPPSSNPFSISGTASGEFFTNRTVEVDRIQRTLTEPGAKLLVYGPRRMGKTSAIERAVQRVRKDGHPAILADFSTASSVTDMAGRVLQAASQALGKQLSVLLQDITSRLALAIQFSADPVTGLPQLSLDVKGRDAPLAKQRATLEGVLDTIDALAAKQGKSIGIVFDEFQEIHQFGGEKAEWHLRGVIQRHHHVSYVLAGSRESLIREMLGKKRAFYELFELLHVGPINPAHMARWINTRMHSRHVAANAAGARIVRLAGPRTRDIVRLARVCFDIAAPAGAVRDRDVELALQRIMDDAAPQYLGMWDTLTSLQQNVLRAVSSGVESLYGRATREMFTLGDSSTVVRAVQPLMRKDLLSKVGSRFTFDDPYFCAWVITNALPDVGIVRSPWDSSVDIVGDSRE